MGSSRASMDGAAAMPLALRIVPANGGYQVSADVDTLGKMNFTATAAGNGAHGTINGHGDDWFKPTYTFDAAFDFQMQGQILTGIVRYRDDSTFGRDLTSTYRCTKAASPKK